MSFLLPYREIAAEVAERLDTSPGEEVIVASGGVAHAIRTEILARRPAGVAGLRLETIETFARRIVNGAGEYPRVASEGERRLAMRTAVRGIDDPIMDSRGIAAMLERSWRDVRDGGLTLSELESRARKARLRNDVRTQLMIRAWREYERLIAQTDAIDPADLLRRAAALIENGGIEVSPQIVAGFYDMTGAQQRIIEALRGASRLAAVYIPAGEGDAYRFARPFIERFQDSDARKSETSPPAWSLTQHDTRVTEIREVCRAIAGLLASGIPARSIGIVARSLEPYDAALLNRFAAGYGFTTTADDAMPLLSHRLGRGIANLLRLRENGFPRGEVIDLLRDSFEPKRRIRIDDVDQATRRARIAGGTSDDLRNVARRPFVDDYLGVLAELETFAPDGSMSGAEAADFLTSAVARFRIDVENDLAAADLIDEVAATFRRASRWSARFDAATIIDALEQQALPSSAGALPSIFAGDVMRFRGRSFEHLFAIRMQDDLFPQRRIDDPLLPDSDRRGLGVRQIGDGRDEERLLFQLLLDASRSIHFSYAGGDGFGKMLRPSSLLKNFVIAQHPATRAALLRNFAEAVRTLPDTGEERAGPEQPPRPAVNQRRQLQLIAKSGSRSVFDGYLFAEGGDETLRGRLADALQSVSPTQLEDFGECPQKFLFKHILGVRDVDDPEHELQINARDKGKVDHGILERFYRSLNDDDFVRAAAALPQLEIVVGERIDSLVDESFAALEREFPPFNPTMREIERSATKRILREFVALDLTDLRDTGFRPTHFEYRFGKNHAERGAVDHAESFTIEVGGRESGVGGGRDGEVGSGESGVEGRRDDEVGSGEWGVGSRRNDEVGGREWAVGSRRDENETTLSAISNPLPPTPDSRLHHPLPPTPHTRVTLRVDGTIDRIDAGGGKYRIIDYKGGKASRHKDLGKKIDRGVRLQLALYAMAVAQFFDADTASVSGAIKPLVAGETNARRFAFALAEKELLLRETLDLFVASILGGAFPAFPNDDDDDFNACKYCPVSHSCRTKHDPSEKYLVTQHRDPRTLLGGSL